MRIKTCLAAVRRAAAVLLRAAGRLGSAIAEMHRQQRRLSTVSQSTDHYLLNADAPPETYREFLARTAGALLHEPSARARLAGHGVR
jgi:hypothetical protein